MFALSLGGNAQLRPLEPWRAREFAAYLDDARPHLAPWLPWARSVTNEAGARRWLQRYADRQARDEGRIYGIWLADKMVGGTLFRVFDVEDGVCEIGVWLAPEAQGRGLVTRAARAHDRLGVRRVAAMSRIEWHCVPNNERKHRGCPAARHDPGRRAAQRVSATTANGSTSRSGRCLPLTGDHPPRTSAE